MKLFIVPLLSCFFISSYAYYYMYPVASLSHDKIILVIRQLSIDHIDLFMWNRETKQVDSGLWSLFNPAEIQILPDESGFSFIDNGRLRIKYFNKRSPRTIDFDQYIYDIHNVRWINTQECYFSAKSVNNNFGIFHCDIDGRVCCAASHDEYNCKYPQKINDELFYIQETKDKKYYIVRTLFSESDRNSRLITFNDNPIIFLTMHSQDKGFVISHRKMIHLDDPHITFDYYHINKKGKNWKKKLLFSFAIPSNLLIKGNVHCLYESLLPLIPRHKDLLIYFVDSLYHQKNKLELFSYNIKSAKRKKICTKNKLRKQIYHIFVPFISDSGLICGGSFV